MCSSRLGDWTDRLISTANRPHDSNTRKYVYCNYVQTSYRGLDSDVVRLSRCPLRCNTKFKMASTLENFSDQILCFRHFDLRSKSKRHSKSLQRTWPTIHLHRTATFLPNFVEYRHFVRLRCCPAARRKAGVTKIAASVIGASRRRRLLVASNHGTPPLIRAPARQTDLPVPVSRFSYIMPLNRWRR